jgi:hypothetical protein
VGNCGLDEFASGGVQVTDSCKHNNEPSGSIKRGEFLDKLSDYYFSRRNLLHVVS